MTPHSNNALLHWTNWILPFGVGCILSTPIITVIEHFDGKQRDRQTAERMWKALSDAPFDATHVFQLRGSQPGYATLTLRAVEQQSYQYGYALTNLTLVVNASGVSVERSGSNLTVTFKP